MASLITREGYEAGAVQEEITSATESRQSIATCELLFL